VLSRSIAILGQKAARAMEPLCLQRFRQDNNLQGDSEGSVAGSFYPVVEDGWEK
jgi:hypothetical protein